MASEVEHRVEELKSHIIFRIKQLSRDQAYHQHLLNQGGSDYFRQAMNSLIEVRYEVLDIAMRLDMDGDSLRELSRETFEAELKNLQEKETINPRPPA